MALEDYIRDQEAKYDNKSRGEARQQMAEDRRSDRETSPTHTDGGI